MPRRWLIIVQPHQQELYDLLKRSLPHDAPITLMYERRLRERRRGSDAPRLDRRRVDRRRRRGSALIYEGGGQTTGECHAPPVASAKAVGSGQPEMSKTCPECGVGLQFEMPRFPQSPARVDIEVIHTRAPSGVQHQVEIAAFSWSGRPLLVQRVQVSRQR